MGRWLVAEMPATRALPGAVDPDPDPDLDGTANIVLAVEAVDESVGGLSGWGPFSTLTSLRRAFCRCEEGVGKRGHRSYSLTTNEHMFPEL